MAGNDGFRLGMSRQKRQMEITIAITIDLLFLNLSCLTE